MILVIDNFDSFTFNLVQALGTFDSHILVKRSLSCHLEKIKSLEPSHIVLSPGPKSPQDAGVTCDVIKHFAGKVPILGVCLGHQAIAYSFGAQIVAAPLPVHGKTIPLKHCKRGIFHSIKQGLRVARYHSLVIDPKTLSDDFEVTASYNQIIMGIRHKKYRALEGIQFHPESFLTEQGPDMLSNFLKN
jgi:anthranilate synthase/aminodeoxychorismate synthase-like glutamine amidotransferase